VCSSPNPNYVWRRFDTPNMSSFLCLSQKAHKESNAAGVGDVTGDVIDRWVSVCDSKSWKKIKR